MSGLSEVRTLQDANPTPLGGLPVRPRVVRAINRSSIVLLYSHLERYLRGVNEEALMLLNINEVEAERIPLPLRLEHSKTAIDDLAEMQWDNRVEKLQAFVNEEGWLWGEAPRQDLVHSRFLNWMKCPKPKNIRRMYRLWSIEDVFEDITRKRQTRLDLELKLTALVDKRSNIAHGDFTTEATRQDVASYARIVEIFSDRADRRLSRTLKSKFSIDSAW